MPKIPLISGDKAVKCFEKLGYEVTRQKGSHLRLLRKLTRDADISIEDLVGLL